MVRFPEHSGIKNGLEILHWFLTAEGGRANRKKPAFFGPYPLDEVLLLALLAVLAGADSFADIARFGGMKFDWLRRFTVSTVGRVLILPASLLTATPQLV